MGYICSKDVKFLSNAFQESLRELYDIKPEYEKKASMQLTDKSK